MKKLSNLKWFTLGIVLTLMVSLLVVPALAKSGQETVTIGYRDIVITLDGQVVVPKDAGGNVVEPFIIDGTTYLPVRGVGSALGLEVGWDAATSTVKLTSRDTPPITGTFRLSAGNYIVGEDIPAGKYECAAVSGAGNFMGTVASLGFMGLNELLGAPGSHSLYSETYSNLRLANGDIVNVSSNLVVEFTPQ